MMKTILGSLSITLCILMLGCASSRPVMPTMDLPQEPVKPKIHSTIISQGNTPWIGYTVQDALKLYEYLLQKDSYEEKLRFRIKTMNEMWR